MKDRYDCIIIGSGIAGYSAAQAFRKKDTYSSLAMITKEEIPLYSPCILPNFVAGEVGRDQVFMKHQVDDGRLQMDRISPAWVMEIDTSNRTIKLEKNGKKILHYGRLILATGSIPAVPPSMSEPLDGLFSFKWFADAENVLNYEAKSVVAVGSGLIGIEVAVALAARGIKVTLLEAMPHLMPMLLDEEPAARVHDLLEQHNVRVVVNTAAEAIAGEDRVRGVITANGEITADMVITAIGMAPDVTLAREAGIGIGSAGGILVGEGMKTDTQDIYACGDCVESRDFLFGDPGLNLFWYFAKIQGMVAGANAAGGSRRFTPQPRIAVTDIFEMPVYSIGFTEVELLRKGKKPRSVIQQSDRNFRKIVLLDGRIVGVQLVNQTRDLAYLIPAVHMRMGLDELERIPRKRVPPLSHLYRYTRYGPFMRLGKRKV